LTILCHLYSESLEYTLSIDKDQIRTSCDDAIEIR
jgi:hypothetical protein